jgi:uncharacterized protein (TIGR02118 family)
MSITLVALYRRPDDVDAFLRHYYDVHLPLVRQTPHLIDVKIREVSSVVMGDLPIFLIAEMKFPDRATFDAAMASAENRVAGKDLMSFAKGLVTLLTLDEQ